MASKENRQPKPNLNLNGVHRFLNATEAPRIAYSRQLAVNAVLGVSVLALCIGMFRMLPLKERVPYVVQNEMDSSGNPTGRLTVLESGMAAFTPQEAHMRSALQEWVVDFLTIDQYTKDQRLPRSYGRLRGDALRDWTAYLSGTHKPLERLVQNPDYREIASVISISFLNKDSALIRVKLTTRNGNERRVVINLRFAIIPPSNDDEVYRNPAGLWITNFGVSNEIT